MSIGKTMLGRRHVLPSVTSTLAELQVEGTFPTGTYLVTVHYPISSDDGDLEKALYGSFLPIPPADAFLDPDPEDYLPEKMPGAVVPVKSMGVTLSEGRLSLPLVGLGISNMNLLSCCHYSSEIAHYGHELVNCFHTQPSLRGYIYRMARYGLGCIIQFHSILL